MCGFIQRVTDSPAVIDLLEEIGLGEFVPAFKNETGSVLNFYPAFGKNAERKLTNIIIGDGKVVDATWWFDCKPAGETLLVGDRTTFNARNLDSPYWKNAIRYHRALIVATGVGESHHNGASKEQYLMQAEGAMLIGAVFRKFGNGLYSSAVITRPPHPRFSKYHDKSIPCFLPHDRAFVSAWLSGEADDPLVFSQLDDPKIYQNLQVTKVKTFKGGEALGDSEILEADSI